MDFIQHTQRKRRSNVIREGSFIRYWDEVSAIFNHRSNEVSIILIRNNFWSRLMNLHI